MDLPYERLPLIDFNAPRALLNSSRMKRNPTDLSILQDVKDAEAVLTDAALNISLTSKNVVQSAEKYMVDTQPDKSNSDAASKRDASLRKRGGRKPHYSRILVFGNKLIFQAACCLPLKIIAATLDGEAVCGRALLDRHTEEAGGKLVYEFQRRGTEMALDLKRGASTRAQRIIFKDIGK